MSDTKPEQTPQEVVAVEQPAPTPENGQKNT
jgi:hypothetical protein